MDFIVNYYFDFKNVVFADGNFEALLKGFWITLKLSILAGVLSLAWGLILAVLRQLPGKVLRAGPLADDRLHRRLPRRPAAAGHPARLGDLGLRRADRRRGAAEGDREPDLVRPAVAVLVRDAGADA